MNEQNNKAKKPSFFKRKQLRYGSYAIVTTILFIAVILLINFAVKAVEDNWALRLDASFNSLTTFSETTKNALKELDKDVKFYVMATPGSENAQIMEVLDRFRASSSHVSVEVVDPDKNPALVNKFRGDGTVTMSNSTVVVTNADETRYKAYSYYDMVNISQDQSSGQYYITSYQYERILIQGMLYATADKTPTAYFMQGHGEPTLANLASLQTLLQSNNYDTAELALGADMPDPEGNILVIVAPQKDIEERDREKVLAFAEGGGGFLFVWEVTTPSDLPNFQTILDYFNVGFAEGMVVADMNDSSQYYYSPNYVLANLGEHEVTEPLVSGNQKIILAMQSRAVAMPEMSKNEVEVTPLLNSGVGSYLADINTFPRTSWARQDGEPEGPLPMAAAVHRHNFTDETKASRAILMGSVLSIADTTLLNSFNNGEFILSAVKWAAKDDAVNLSIISKTANRGTLRISSQSEMNVLTILSIVVLPLVVLIAGVIVWLRRRHL